MKSGMLNIDKLRNAEGQRHWYLSAHNHPIRYKDARNLFIMEHVRCMGYVVAKLDEALHYKPEGHRFNSHWCHQNFALT